MKAKEQGDPQGWLAFQTAVSSLKLQRTRLEREAADIAGGAEGRQRARRGLRPVVPSSSWLCSGD